MYACSAAPGSRAVALPGLAATAALGRRVARLLRAGDVVCISGDLGAGKTTLVRSILAGLGVAEEVPSPTFSLVQTYACADFTVWHFDLYRLTAPDDIYELGIEDAFAEGVSLIEWPERLGALLPADRLDIHLIALDDAEHRRAELAAHGSWRERVERVAAGD